MKLALQVPTQYSNFSNVITDIQNKLGNRALKSVLKSTVTKTLKFFNFSKINE